MKILTLHVDYINFKPLKKALKSVGALTDKEKKGEKVKESLVVLTAVEEGDNIRNSVKELVKNVKDVAGQVNVKDIVLYPYAHLSSNLASPDVAVEILKGAGKELRKNFNVTSAPFGYYKEFELKVKGHPLSELSREIRTEGKKGKEESYDYKQILKGVSKTKLDSSKLKKNDHRIIGQQMDLFSFSETAPGMVFWHHNGLIVKDELIKFWKEIHDKAGYQEVSTPQILDKKLWQISGHWEKYRKNIFLTDYDNHVFAVKPMNCPGGILVFKNKPKSYKDLPLRVGELGIVHRQELSGVLGGLFRVIQFTQDDAHIYCTEKQLESELIKVINLMDLFYKQFDLPYKIELSTRPKKRIGSEKVWDKAEKTLVSVLKKKKIKFKLNKGEGVFYGPKIDFNIKDSLGRTWQCGTLQLDFSMPERFDLVYIDKDNKRKRPIMLHRAIYGSLERFIGILIEHYKGHLPTWLSPVQVRVLSLTERNKKAAEKIHSQLIKEGVRSELNIEEAPVSGRIRNAEVSKIPFVVLIGDKEQKNKTLAIRHKSKVKFNVKINSFIKNLKKEIDERK
jgi:threonyl-tRNA synthetase